jgi:hypothetical protein
MEGVLGVLGVSTNHKEEIWPPTFNRIITLASMHHCCKLSELIGDADFG